MQLFLDFDSRMRRAVQQESRSLSSGVSKRKKASQPRCCLLVIMITPLFLVLLLMYILSMYNAIVEYDHRSNQLLNIAEQPPIEAEQASKQKAIGDDEEKEVNRRNELLRRRQADANRLQAANSQENPSTLILTTKLGPIKITMRPDLSRGSVDYIQRLIDSKVCRRCNFYRAEKPGILQGVMANREVPTNSVFGSCPKGAEDIHNDCPNWDKNCACHGPLMKRGSVAWAAGQAGGPDFFIDAYAKPATWWGTQHTNFGFIEDTESMKIVDRIFDLPAQKHGGMTHLDEPIHFDMKLVQEAHPTSI